MLVAVVAYCTTLEFAGCGFAASIVTTTFLTTAVTVFTLLDNAITALLSCNRGDSFVVGKACRIDTVAAHCATDVADTAWTEVGDAGRGGRVHDVFRARIASTGAERAALGAVGRT